MAVCNNWTATVRRGFAPRPGHTKDHHKNCTNCLPETCIKISPGTVERVGYCISVLDLASATWPLMPKKTTKHSNGLI